jgi:hypothetical protein
MYVILRNSRHLPQPEVTTALAWQNMYDSVFTKHFIDLGVAYVSISPPQSVFFLVSWVCWSLEIPVLLNDISLHEETGNGITCLYRKIYMVSRTQITNVDYKPIQNTSNKQKLFNIG